MRKSLWSPDEDEKLRQYVAKHGCGNWSDVAKHTGLRRCGKSCRLRWINYLRPDLKRGPFTGHEVRLVVHLHNNLGNSWSKIATHLPGRTDNDVKNFWHSYTRSRRLQQQQQLQTAIQAEKDGGSSNEEIGSYSDDRNAKAALQTEKTKSLESLEQYGDTIDYSDLCKPAFRFQSSISRGMYMDGYTAVGSEHEQLLNNLPAFSYHNTAFNNYKHLSPSAAGDRVINTSNSSSRPSYYSGSANMASMQAARMNVIASILQIDKPPPITMYNRICTDLEGANAPASQATHSQLCSQSASTMIFDSYTAPFDHQSISLQEASSSAVTSNYSHVREAADGAGQEWSLMFSPSTINKQGYNLINSHIAEEKCTPVAIFDQINPSAGVGVGVKSPEGLQSVIWSFINQQEACMAASSSCLADEEKSEEKSNDPELHNHPQKPSSAAFATSFDRKSQAEIHHSMAQFLALDQYLDVPETVSYSSSNVLHLLQDQQGIFLDEHTNRQGPALCSST